MRLRIRRLAALLAITMSLCPAAFMPPEITHAQLDEAYELFFSEQTGYFFFWDPDSWSLESQASEPGVDSIHFSNGQVLASYSAFLAPGVTPTQCLRHIIDELTSDQSILEIETIRGGGHPVVEEVLQGRTVSDLALSLEGTETPASFLVRLVCTEIQAGRSLLSETFVMPGTTSEGPDDLYAAYSAGPALASAELWDDLEAGGYKVTIPGESGDFIGAITSQIGRICSRGDSLFGGFLLAQSVAGEPDVVIDPSSFEAFDAAGNSLPTALDWLYPDVSIDTPVELRSGEFVLLQVYVNAGAASDINLFFSPSGSDSRILIPLYSFGCGAGGAAPVLIDLE